MAAFQNKKMRHENNIQWLLSDFQAHADTHTHILIHKHTHEQTHKTYTQTHTRTEIKDGNERRKNDSNSTFESSSHKCSSLLMNF